MTNVKLESMFPTLGPLKFELYGEDETLTRDKRKASSRPIPGRFICRCGIPVWSTNHEVGNRKLIEEWETPSHSFVRNFYTVLISNAFDIDSLGLTAQCACYGAGKFIMKETDATFGALTQAVRGQAVAGASGNGYRAQAGNNTNGVQTGTGTTAESFEDFQLATLIAEGCSSGQFSHVAMVDYTQGCDKPTYSACTTKWTINYPRFFNNNSGGTIVVAEVGLVLDPCTPAGNHMMARDLIACGCRPSVLDAGQLKVTYTMISPAVA